MKTWLQPTLWHFRTAVKFGWRHFGQSFIGAGDLLTWSISGAAESEGDVAVSPSSLSVSSLWSESSAHPPTGRLFPGDFPERLDAYGEQGDRAQYAELPLQSCKRS